MTSAEFNKLLKEAGVTGADGWQGLLIRLGIKIAIAVAPQAMALLETLLVRGADTLIKRLAAAMAPAETPDYALLIVEGIERDHGPGGSMELWPSAQRAEYARDAIRQWLIDKGADASDESLVNQVVEEAVGKMKLKQAQVAKGILTT